MILQCNLFYLLRCLDNKGLQTIVYLIHPETIKRFEAESFKCVNVIKTNTIKIAIIVITNIYLCLFYF